MMTEFYAKFAPWLDDARNFDAPPPEEAELLLKALDGIEFTAPEKVGRRTYDDGKFYRSIQDKFEEDRKITAKQYQALLGIAAKYRNQLDGKLGTLPEAIRTAVDSMAMEQAEREEKREQSQAAAAAINYAGLFAAFDHVTFEPPTKRGRFTYDDKKFVQSLKRQALDGKALSEKQNAALRRMAQKYRGELTDPALVDSILGQAAAAVEMAGTADGVPAAAPAAPNPAVDGLLDGLSKVTAWAEPVKKGRFTYDDKEFYESIAKQHASGRILSDRQVAALKKMASKYGIKCQGEVES
ncbi:hypothetical protein SDC9_135648 [bioreactor metagenome]|uniref:Uncharacterized protein n=1 Tax=bioreactor metagenome TaxID=1076179 RepID=A0A645DGE9_9ZZZZ